MLQGMGCIDIQEVFNDSLTNRKPRKKKLSNKITLNELANTDDEQDDIDDLESNNLDRVVAPGQASSAFRNFVPTTKLKGMEDWVEEEHQFKYIEPTADFVATSREDEPLQYPPLLKAFAFPRGDVSRFPPPKRSSLGTSSK